MAFKAPVLDAAGQEGTDLELEDAVFGAEVKPHLVHETVRAEMAAARAGTRGAKSRGMVSGGTLEAVAPEGHRARPRRARLALRSGPAAASPSRRRCAASN